MRRYVFPLILGLGGMAILISLGLWQVRRMDWKRDLLAMIDARIAAPPIDLSILPAPDPVTDRYRAVSVSGTTTGEDLLFLTGKKGVGAGYEVIAAFETAQGRRVMVDLGFIPESLRDTPRPGAAMHITGNLVWPDEQDSYTPAPDKGLRLWFARDVASMSLFLQTEPVLVVARTAQGSGAAIVPVPVNTSGIPNNHRQYASTWFTLSAVWMGMTGYLLWRTSRRTL